MRRLAALLAALALAGCSDPAASRADGEARAGIAAAKEGRLDEAMERFASALELDPANQMATFNLGLAYFQVAQWRQAEETFARFVELRPDDARGHFELARARALAGYDHAALQSLAQAVRLGFADHGMLVRDGIFSTLYANAQYVALEMTVAQRAGIAPEGGALGGPGADQLGGSTITLPKVRLPGLGKPCAQAEAGGLCAD